MARITRFIVEHWKDERERERVCTVDTIEKYYKIFFSTALRVLHIVSLLV